MFYKTVLKVVAIDIKYDKSTLHMEILQVAYALARPPSSPSCVRTYLVNDPFGCVCQLLIFVVVVVVIVVDSCCHPNS